MTYSPFFDVMYDQREPVGDFGHGTHYSVLRATVWRRRARRPSKRAQLLDFAVIWDKSHDDRVIEVIERMYFESLLTPVLFIGGRSYCLSIVPNWDVVGSWSSAAWRRYREAVSGIGPCEDPWPAHVGEVGPGLAGNSTIIKAPDREVATYLSHIELLWQLGLKPVCEHWSRSLAARMAEERRPMIEAQEASRCVETENDEIPF